MTLRGVAWVVGVAAALGVVGTTAAALTQDGPSPRATAGGLGTEWRKTSSDDAIEYRDGTGRSLVRVTAPWVYREDVCGSQSTTRAFAGRVPRLGRTAAELAQPWAAAISLDVVTGRHLAHTPVVASGDRADTEVDVPAGPCNPPREHLTVLTSGDQALVLVRDLGVPDALTASDADHILTALLTNG